MATLLKGMCSVCKGEVTLGAKKLSNNYEVSCEDCSHVFYLGNDLTNAVNILMDVDSDAKKGNKNLGASPKHPYQPKGKVRTSAHPNWNKAPPGMNKNAKKTAGPRPTSQYSKGTTNKWKLTASPVDILKRKCPVCGGKVFMSPRTSSNGWKVYCAGCWHVFYEGTEYDDGIEAYDIATSNKGTKPAKPSSSSWIKNATTKASGSKLSKKCPKCGKHGLAQYGPSLKQQYKLKCCICGHVFYTGNSMRDMGLVYADLGSYTAEPPKLSLTQKQAYEKNKERDTCILCSAPLGFHPSVSVKYCKCIESLA